MSKWFFILLFFLPSLAKSQNINIATTDKDLIEILKTIEIQAGIYFSYDPVLFVRESKRSVNYRNSSLQTVLADLLGSKYVHERVGDYIVISLPKSTYQKPSVSRVPARPKRKEAVARDTLLDTVTIEKLIYVYDTVRVVLSEKHFDTVRVKTTEIVYDTFRVEPTRKKFGWVPYASFFRWTVTSRQLASSQDYAGIGVGLSREFAIQKRIMLSAGIQYSQQFQNIKIRGDSTGSISDDTTTQQNSFGNVNRLNFLRLQSNLAFRVLRVSSVLEIDVDLGFSVYKSLKANEIFIRKDGIAIESKLRDYKQPFYNLSLAVPLSWRMNRDFRLAIVPFVEWGLNRYKISDLSLRRRVVGIAFKFRCF